jgi:hypothetical protein
MFHRPVLASRNMSEGLHTLFKAVIRVNYVKKSEVGRRLCANLCDNMATEYMAVLYYCQTRWVSRTKVLYRVFELKKVVMFLSDSNENK